jgi:hypothetical protein
VLSALEQAGLLLEADARLPSIASLVAGGPITGSWWGHPAGRAIFAVAASLASSPDSLVTKLVSAKITYVHRRLWLSAYAVATAREAWQTAGLSPTARALLRDVDRRGEIRNSAWSYTPRASTRRPARTPSDSRRGSDGPRVRASSRIARTPPRRAGRSRRSWTA